MQVVLRPGEMLTIIFADENDNNCDGEFLISYKEDRIRVTADLPDDQNREGEIYCVTWGRQFVLYHSDTECYYWGHKETHYIPEMDSEEGKDEWATGPIEPETTRFSGKEMLLFNNGVLPLPEGTRFVEVDFDGNHIDETVPG